MTRLTKRIDRLTARTIRGRNVIVSLAPAGTDNDALIGLRLKGTRTQYVMSLSDVYRVAAMWHGQAEAQAKREARRLGVSWITAKKEFNAHKRIPETPSKKT